MPDSTYSDRQRAQSYLIRHLDEVHRITGRTAGFDDKKTSDLPLGPPPVVITRMSSDERGSNGKLLTTSTSINDANTDLNTLTPSLYFALFKEGIALDAIIDDLVPDIKLFKVYTGTRTTELPGFGTVTEEEAFEVEFSNDWLGDTTPQLTALKGAEGAGVSEPWAQHFGSLGDPPKVGMTEVTIQRLGGNPAEIESNIKVSITIETMNLNNLFLRYVTKEMKPASMSQAAWEKSLEDPAKQPPGMAWIDLIKMNPNATNADNVGTRVYDESETQIKLQIGYDLESPERKAAINQVIKEGGIPAEAWDHQMVQAQVDAGSIVPGSDRHKEAMERADQLLQGAPEEAGDPAQEIIDAVNAQKETYHLVLQNHELTVEPNLRVRMVVNFIGYGEAMQRLPKSDLLGDPVILEELDKLSKEMDDIAQRSAALKTQSSVDEMPTDTPAEVTAKEKAEAQNKIQDACAEGLDEELAVVQRQYDKQLLISKRALHDQIKLAGDLGTSRIYEILVPDNDPVWSEPRPGLAQDFLVNPTIINYAEVGPDGDIQEQLQREQTGLGASDVAQGPADEIPGKPGVYQKKWVTHEQSEQQRKDLLSNVRENLGYRIFQFVFLGDIVEAALEILARNNNFVSKDRSQYKYGPSVTFFNEMSNEGTMGPIAQKIIQRFGKYVFGDIKLPQLAGEDEPRYANIADIPIEFEQFRTYWYNEVVSKPKMEQFFLANLMAGLINKLIPYAIDNRAARSANSKNSDTVQAIATHFSLAGNPSDLNTSMKVADIPPPTPDETLATLASGATEAEAVKAHTEARDKWVQEMVELSEKKSLRYAGYLKSQTLKNKLNINHIKAIIDTSKPMSTYNVFAVTQKASSDIQRGMGKNARANDEADGIPWFQMKMVEKGMLMGVQFKRSDLPGLREANLQADGGANKLGILREKYDATVLLRGNVAFKPGTVVYVDPDSLATEAGTPSREASPLYLHDGRTTGIPDLTKLMPAPLMAPGTPAPPLIHLSAARLLGIGGYFTVISVSHDFGDLGGNADWKTTLDTRWLSFAHIPGMTPSRPKKSTDDVKLSPKDQVCTEQRHAEAYAALAKEQAIWEGSAGELYRSYDPNEFSLAVHELLGNAPWVWKGG